MKIGTSTDHLTYCLNIHPGESWTEIREAIREKAVRVRGAVAPDRPFGLGLRLGARAAAELGAPGLRREIRAELEELGLYVFTLNGFVHGAFHGARVKERAYQPDWRTAARKQYTLQLADILADWLPDGVSGSISTVPGSFKPWVLRPDDPARMVRELMDCVLHFARLHQSTGKELHLGLEPEPSCYLETTEETVGFFKQRLWREGAQVLSRRAGVTPGRAEEWIRRHLGVCFDTCHVALQFENLERAWATYEAEGIRISKTQLSAALQVYNERTRIEALHPFVEPTYLHQVKVMTRHGAIRSWTDLPDALRIVKDQAEYEELRIHFHVPLHWPGSAKLSSTRDTLTDAFFAGLRQSDCRHWEVETYTFDVLPPDIRPADVVESIREELQWVLHRAAPEGNRSLPPSNPSARPAGPSGPGVQSSRPPSGGRSSRPPDE